MHRDDRLSEMLEALRTGSLAAAARCFSTGATYREAHKEAIHGRDAIAAHFARFAASAGRWTFAVDELIRDEDRACVVYRFQPRGGEGEPQRERAGCATVRLDERGTIAEWREYEG